MGSNPEFLIGDAAGRAVSSSPGLAARLGVTAARLAPGTAIDALPTEGRLTPTPLCDGLTLYTLAPEGNDPASLRAEIAMLHDTLNALDAGVVVYDSDLRYRFGNRIYHETFPDLPPDEVLVGQTYAQVLARSIIAGTVTDPQAYTDQAAFIARREREVADRGRSTREVRAVGTERSYELRTEWTPLGNRVSLRIDTSRATRMHRELLRAQRMEAVAKLSGEVAHDFNNLLTVILGNLELMQLRYQSLPAPFGAELAALGEAALAAAEAGARLTGELLSFARPAGADGATGRAASIDPGARIAGIAELLRRAAGPTIALAIDAPAGLCTVGCEAAQFEAAVMNLITNSREAIARRRAAAPQAPAAITIALGVAGDAMELSVADTGCGMSAAFAAQAVEPFVTTKPPGEGPGLGLSQVHSFALAAGGELRIEGGAGTGAIVTLCLPASPAVAPPQPVLAAAPAPAPEGATASAPKGATILVVEDDPDVLATVSRLIRGLGYQLLAATGAEDALLVLQSSQPIELLFSDIVMPGSRLNGVQLAHTATTLRPGLPVLLTTGYSADALQYGLPAGTSMLRKPYRHHELATRLAALAGPAVVDA
jgi:signal transduction histidine kinase/CheY-like chemotaxis protein